MRAETSDEHANNSNKGGREMIFEIRYNKSSNRAQDSQSMLKIASAARRPSRIRHLSAVII